jgi:two-component system, NtrC family, sensor kinase
MRVLLAEDDPVSRRLLQSYLEKWGHEVIATETGEEAWRLFQTSDFAMVISDWMMPGMDGLELLRRIRAARKSAYVYTVLLTARSHKEDLVKGMEAGADDFVSKPFDRDELRVRIRAGERIVQLERDLAAQNRALRETLMHSLDDSDIDSNDDSDEVEYESAHVER